MTGPVSMILRYCELIRSDGPPAVRLNSDLNTQLDVPVVRQEEDHFVDSGLKR